MRKLNVVSTLRYKIIPITYFYSFTKKVKKITIWYTLNNYKFLRNYILTTLNGLNPLPSGREYKPCF